MSRPKARQLSKKERLRHVALASLMATAAALDALPDSTGPPALAGDVLEGAAAIAEFLWAKSGPRERRRVYWLVETGQLPVFYYNQLICARKTTLLRDIAQREAKTAELNAESAA
jgi:hypothetical protein